MLVLVLIAVIAVAAVAAVTILNTSNQDNPINQGGIEDTINDTIPTEPLPIEEPVTVDPIPETETALPEDEPTTDETVPEDSQEEDNETLDSASSFVDDGTRDGITHLYFARKEDKESNESAGMTNDQEAYEIDNPFTVDTEKEANDITAKIKSSIDSKVRENKKYVKEETVREKIKIGADFKTEPQELIHFELHKIVPHYEKTDSAPLESELYVFAKTANLDEKEITINIKEKEHLLLDEADANLNVVLVDGEGDDAKEGEEVTDLKATVEDGQAAIKIILKPKDEEDDEGATPNLDEWKRRIEGITQDGTHSYAVEDSFTTSDDLDVVASRIESESNETLKPNHFTLKEDIISNLAANTTYNNSTTFVFPKYKEVQNNAEDYTYTFTNPNGTSIGHPGTDNTERRNYIAGIIESNIIEGKKLNQPEQGNNPKLEDGITIKVEDISKALTEPDYARGDTITFPSYKKIKPLLWLKGSCNGDEHEDLNQSGDEEGTYFKIGKNCDCEARVRAYMRMLRVGEGTTGEQGYTKLFGRNNDFTEAPYNRDMSTHPQIKIYWYTNDEGEDVHSSASGAYQVMGYTWDDMSSWRDQYGITDFSPLNQDRFCLILMKHKQEASYRNLGDRNDCLLDLVLEGKIQEANEVYGSYEWASLPPGRYGQPAKTMEDSLKLYEDYLKEELAGNSDLHLEKGFLKEFGYEGGICECEEEENTGDWRDPVDNPQITIYTQGGSKRPWRSAFGDVRRDIRSAGLNHGGLDLFATIGTNVFASLPGTVTAVSYQAGGAGHYIKIKVLDDYVAKFHELRRSYNPYYVKSNRNYDENEYDIEGYPDFIEQVGVTTSTEVHFLYMHLQSGSINVSVGDIISESDYKTKVIAKTGDTGASGTKGPHLHFEIRNASTGGQKFNPAYYINYKNETELSASERQAQDTAAGK